MTALVGRILIALLFAYFGYLKLVGFHGTVGYFAKWGFPLPEVAAVISVIFELGGGVLLILGWKTRWVAWALVLYTIIATAVAHRFWTYAPEQAFAQTSFFFKNLSVIGGLILLSAFGPGPASVDRR